MKKLLAVILMLVIFLTTFASCTKGGDIVDTSITNQVADQQVPPTQENGGQNENDANKKEDVNNEDADSEEDENEDEGNDECDHEGGEDATCITESICSICDEFYGGFDDGNHEGDEEWISTESSHKLVYSCCELVVEEESAHSFVDGICSVCNYECANHDSDGHSCKNCHAFIEHSYGSNNKCSVCGLVRNGKKVTFGSYPQSKVTDSSIASALNNKAGKPTTNATVWNVYDYAGFSKMWYSDVEYNGAKYRGVYMTAYRPNNFDSTFTQQTNGYSVNTVYWFKYDAIEWTILEENGGKALIFCNMIIDSQEFDSENDNSYAESTIRAWLNETFYDTAFNELQKGVIVETLVDNDGISTGYNPPRFPSEDTNDKIFLLSRADVKNTSYGFTNSGETTDSARQKKATDYAKIQGASTSTKDGAPNSWWWWTRTAAPKPNTTVANDIGNCAHRISANGTITTGNADTTTGGVVPAMWIYI